MMYTLTDEQRTWIERILANTTYNSGYTSNMRTILRKGKYTTAQRHWINIEVNPTYAHYLKTH